MITQSFTATGPSVSSLVGPGPFNFSVSGGSGTIVVERSFDDGSTWKTVKTVTADYEGVGYEAEYGTKYRLNCTAYTSGTIECRIGTRQA